MSHDPKGSAVWVRSSPVSALPAFLPSTEHIRVAVPGFPTASGRLRLISRALPGLLRLTCSKQGHRKPRLGNKTPLATMGAVSEGCAPRDPTGWWCGGQCSRRGSQRLRESLHYADDTSFSGPGEKLLVVLLCGR